MAGGISVHGVDVARGRPAEGMRVEVYALTGDRRLIAEGHLGKDGLLTHPIVVGDGVDAGPHEVLFHIAEWLSATGCPEEQTRFLDVLPFRFVVSNVDEHYHLPLKFTPWGLALFRGI